MCYDLRVTQLLRLLFNLCHVSGTTCRSLRPWQHYAPFQSGATAGEEVLDIVNRLRANDKKAQQIAETAQKWAYR